MERLPCIEMKRKKVAACEKDGSGRFPATEANSDTMIQPDEEAAESSGVEEYFIIDFCKPSVWAQSSTPVNLTIISLKARD